jgi:hypothetical protein
MGRHMQDLRRRNWPKGLPAALWELFFRLPSTLIADPSITKQEEAYFNAARLDRSMALRMSDYIALAKPWIERIAAS